MLRQFYVVYGSRTAYQRDIAYESIDENNREVYQWSNVSRCRTFLIQKFSLKGVCRKTQYRTDIDLTLFVKSSYFKYVRLKRWELTVY